MSLIKPVSLLVFAFCIVSQVFAEPSCQLDANKAKFFRLDLTVPATFCRSSTGDPSCSVFPKASLIQLHGLWPNYDKGFPTGECSATDCPVSDEPDKYCLYPKPDGLYQSSTWGSLSGYMAGTEKCLERHEWVKHGTCSGMQPQQYFQWALEETKRIADALSIPADTVLSQSELDDRIAQRIPELNGAVHFTCKGDSASGMYIFFEWGDEPGAPRRTKGGANSYGNCKKNLIFPSRP